MIRHFFWWLHRRKHGYPSQDEIFVLFPRIHALSTPRIREASLHYMMGYSICEIAERMNCTRERIRQMIMKARRQALVVRKSRETQHRLIGPRLSLLNK